MERSGGYLVGRISTSPIYLIDITGQDPLSLGDLEGRGVYIEKLEKMRYF